MAIIEELLAKPQTRGVICPPWCVGCDDAMEKKTGICSCSACAVLVSGRIWESQTDSTQLWPVQLVLHRCSSKSVSGWIMEIWPHSTWYYGAFGIEDTTNYGKVYKKNPLQVLARASQVLQAWCHAQPVHNRSNIDAAIFFSSDCWYGGLHP
ncbi:unnamed protein product [Trifolium pratense]|uniref:Uncharacterized protein n=1 Tax=Trifolium pratense TaxID=57577 RepID=A0ACB0L0C7_TRIPR|nr:unnamed protein product [Trifolium pratense]